MTEQFFFSGSSQKSGPEVFFEKVKRCINSGTLANIIHESFPHKELAKLMSSLGVVYPGVRVESIDQHDLARDFAEDAWNNPILFASLEKALDKVHQEDLSEIRSMKQDEIKSALKQMDKVFLNGAVGKMVWVLLKDDRHEVTALLKPFLKKVYRCIKDQYKEVQKAEDFMDRMKRGTLSAEENRALRDMLLSSRDKHIKLEQKLKEKERKIESMASERDALKKEIGGMKRENGALSQALASLRKEIEKEEAEISRLAAEAKSMSKSEERKLRHQLHDFEREARKREHELSVMKGKLSLMEERFQSKNAECIRLAADIELYDAEKTRFEEQIKRVIESSSLKPASEAEIASKPVSVPKEKGRRLGVFLDAQYLWYAARTLEKKIDFGELLDLIVPGRHLVKAMAYVVIQSRPNQELFLKALERKGFEVRSKALIRRADGSTEGSWDTGIVTDVIRLVDRSDLDIVHLVTGDGDFTDLCRFLKTKGIRVETSSFPFNTAQDLIKCVDEFFPLDERVFRKESSAVSHDGV